MSRAIMAVVVLALALPAPTHAAAAETNAPPGNSAIDEYLETVPGTTGNATPRTGGGAVLSAMQRARLERLGADGKTLADAVDTTAPRTPRATSHPKLPRGSGRSPASEVLDAVAGGDGGGNGMGLLLPAILIATLIAALMVVLRRRRASS